ncbi:phage tail tube protein [Puniceibacterium sp. IMCC21224]|uniref:phage tail tube protein n=1 Tax=Puniceibacterium sp. IMCC21224 TaxID=1618204 RepID=UPI00064D9C2D|nr:phage tail tube protein [Puniceibacterium sp. IMCC21224]KMK68582.1 hypothetical protein IMCC21224_113465 [Puniceibacterium sp. IMCC21224]
MADRFERKLAILHKIETTYATDITPGTVDAMIASNVTFSPMEGEDAPRDLILPHLGSQGIILAGIYARLEFNIEIAGAGAAGTVPRYGSLLRICGFSETVTAATDVTYEIIEDDVDSGSIYFVMDKVRHVLLGSRGTVAKTYNAKGIPQYRFNLMGLLGTISDQTNPAVSAAGLIKPLPVSKANTVLTLHGWTSVAESLSIDLGNTVTPRFLIGEEEIKITNRQSTGTAVLKATSLATINWFAIAQARTRAALSIVHGTTAGNIVEITAPEVEIGRPTQGATDGIVNYSLPLMLCPDTGLDEMKIVVR